MSGVGTFEFNGVDSSDFDIFCKSVNRPLLPEQRPKMLRIQGKSGVFDFGGGTYETREVVLHITYAGSSHEQFRSKLRDIAGWLASPTWARLCMGDEPDKFYLARIVDEVGLKSLLAVGEADITFTCQPFAYQIFDTGAIGDPTWNEADFPWVVSIPWIVEYDFTATGMRSFDFDNPGTVTIDKNSPQGSKSQIKVVGDWTTLELTLNGKALAYTEAAVAGELIIDNVYLEVTIDGDNGLEYVEGDLDSFLPIIPGENSIEVDGTGLDVTVTIDFTPAWL